jgi:DNA-binding beta-propeller fold protein YncE
MDVDMLGAVGGMGILVSLWASLCVFLVGMVRAYVPWGDGVLSVHVLSVHVGIVVVAVSLLVLVFGARSAEASYENLGGFAASGSGEGELGGAATGVAVNDASGEVYISDGFHSRVTRFDSRGNFLGAWGWNVTATGPDKAGADLVEAIIVKATAGKFTLRYEGVETKEFEVNVGEGKPTTVEVEEALNELPSIKEEGKFKVGGGPADGTGSKPYVITYEDAIGDEEQSSIVPVNKGLTGGVPSSSVTLKVEQEGEPGFEDCVRAAGDVCRPGRRVAHGEGVGEFGVPQRIAVDQVTGDVYVLDTERSSGVVQVFSSDGGHLITSFGVRGNSPLSGESPERIRVPQSIAVDSSGNVYVGDGGLSGLEARVMVFQPKAGSSFTEYEYMGELAKGHAPAQVGTDSAGDVYVDTEEVVYKFMLGDPVPKCESGKYVRLGGMVVNPVTGGVFVYSNSHMMFYRLNSSCIQEEEFPGVPREMETLGLAFNPGLAWKSCVERSGGKYTDGTCSKEGPPGGYELVGGRPPGVLYAVNPGAPGFLDTGLIFAPSVVLPPRVVSVGVSGVGGTSATLDARIDTRGSATHYKFLYYSTAAGAVCSLVQECEAPSGGGVLEPGSENVAASVGRLSPETTYHFRVVGYSNCNPENFVDECPLEGGVEHEFTTFPSGVGVGDGRAYELVSPVLKDGGEVFPANPFTTNCNECLPGLTSEHFPMQSDAGGERVVYEGEAFTATGDAIDENEYFATRTATGWRTSDLSPVGEVKIPPQGYKAFSSDLSVGALGQVEPSLVPEPEAPAGYPNVYLENTASGGLHPVIAGRPPNREAEGAGANEFDARFAGASTDLGHVVFTANDALVSGGGALEAELAADVQGEVAKHENRDYLYEWFGGRVGLVGVLPEGEGGKVLPGASFDAVSEDGSRVYFSDGSGQVYVRVDGEKTFKVPDTSGFVTSSADGLRVLLNDGYVYEVNEGEEKLEAIEALTQGHGGFRGILGSSKDLSSVYFVDTELLAGENAEHKTPTEDANNLYLSRGGSVVFIASLAAPDDGDGAALGVLAGQTGDWAASATHRTARVTPDGRYAAFMSLANLTGYESNGTFEVFEYDAVSERLVCASCNPTGELPAGSSTLGLIDPAGLAALPAPSNLSENGRVFFDSLDVLSPLDKNGLENVYEYEPDGLGTCKRGGGCIYLISSGTGETNADFVNATPSGSDVFFTTRSEMVPQDKDDLIDLYDAREPHTPGEQVAFPPETVSSECSSGEECRPSSSSLSSPSNLGSPLSAVLSGQGNLAPSPPSPNKPPPSLTRAQKLAKALRACHGQRSKKKRATCETRARRAYGVKASAKRSKTSRNAFKTTTGAAGKITAAGRGR